MCSGTIETQRFPVSAPTTSPVSQATRLASVPSSSRMSSRELATPSNSWSDFVEPTVNVSLDLLCTMVFEKIDGGLVKANEPSSAKHR